MEKFTYLGFLTNLLIVCPSLPHLSGDCVFFFLVFPWNSDLISSFQSMSMLFVKIFTQQIPLRDFYREFVKSECESAPVWSKLLTLSYTLNYIGLLNYCLFSFCHLLYCYISLGFVSGWTRADLLPVSHGIRSDLF